MNNRERWIDEPCPMCDEPIEPSEAWHPLGTPEGMRCAHRVCLLREVMGGIGHLIAHEYWCTQHADPDAGLTRYQSAMLVDMFVNLVGIDAAVERGRVEPG